MKKHAYVMNKICNYTYGTSISVIRGYLCIPKAHEPYHTRPQRHAS